LTCRAPLLAPSHFAGLVFCDAAPVQSDDVAVQTSPELICEFSGLPCWGQVPFLNELTPNLLAEAAQKFLSIPRPE
jgi:hypothetical protein